jgi:hypothetical protein
LIFAQLKIFLKIFGELKKIISSLQRKTNYNQQQKMFQRNKNIATKKWSSPIADHSFSGANCITP